MTRLLIADVDQIQKYVFASSRLREMAGASRLIESWSVAGVRKVLAPFGRGNWDDQGICDRTLEDGLAWEVLVSAAGMLVMRLASEVACQELESAVRLAFMRAVPGATLTTASVNEHDTLAASTRALNRELRRSKNAPSHAIVPGLPVAAQRCPSCAEHPASHQDDSVCDVCAAKRAGRSGPHPELVEWKAVSASDLELSAGPFEFDRLADARGFIGVIVGDGDGIGELWEQLDTASSMRRFSEQLAGSMKTAVRKSLEAVRPATRSRLLAIEVAMFGGDDVTLVCPGDRAVELAEALSREFQLASAPAIDGLGLDRERLTMSTGTAVVKASHPFKIARQAAYECLQRAKAGRRMSRDGGECGYLDFAVLTADHPSSRQRALGERVLAGTTWGKVAELHLTARPYPVGDRQPDPSMSQVSDAASLLAVARALSGVPAPQRGKMHDLDTVLRLSGDEDIAEAYPRIRDQVRSIVARMREMQSGDHAAGSIIEHTVASESWPWDGPYPLQTAPAEYHRTPIADVIELSRCIGGQDR